MTHILSSLIVALVLSAVLWKPARLAARLLVRECRHLKHFVLELLICRLYAKITRRIDENQGPDWKTLRLIQRYEHLKKKYRENYEKEHPSAA